MLPATKAVCSTGCFEQTRYSDHLYPLIYEKFWYLLFQLFWILLNGSDSIHMLMLSGHHANKPLIFSYASSRRDDHHNHRGWVVVVVVFVAIACNELLSLIHLSQAFYDTLPVRVCVSVTLENWIHRSPITHTLHIRTRSHCTTHMWARSLCCARMKCMRLYCESVCNRCMHETRSFWQFAVACIPALKCVKNGNETAFGKSALNYIGNTRESVAHPHSFTRFRFLVFRVRSYFCSLTFCLSHFIFPSLTLTHSHIHIFFASLAYDQFSSIVLCVSLWVLDLKLPIISKRTAPATHFGLFSKSISWNGQLLSSVEYLLNFDILQSVERLKNQFVWLEIFRVVCFIHC